MSFYSLPALVAFAINTSLAIIILLDSPKSWTRGLFTMLVACFALWDVADIIVVNSATAEGAMVGGTIMVGALTSASALFLILSFSFPVRENNLSVKRIMVAGLLLPALALTALSAFHPPHPVSFRVLSDTSVFHYTSDLIGGHQSIAFVLVLFYVLWGIWNLLMRHRAARDRTDRRQIRHFLLGAVGFVLFVFVTELLRDNESLYYYSSRGLLLLSSLFFSFVILGNRVVALRRLSQPSMGYSVGMSLAYSFFIIILVSAASVVQRGLKIQSFLAEAVVIVVLTFAFRPLIVHVEMLIDRMLHRGVFTFREKYLQFTREVFFITEITGLSQAVVRFLQELLSASAVDVMVRDDTTRDFRSILRPDRRLSPGKFIQELLAKPPRAYTLAEITGQYASEERQLFKGFEVVAGLCSEKGMIGLVLVGAKTNHRLYTTDELDSLSIFAHEVTIAYSRTLLLEKVRQEQVKATQAEKLATLGRLTAGIAHEFRNPLNHIATSAQTMLLNPARQEVQHEMAGYVLEETKRLNQMVETFLEFAKPHKPVWEKASVEDVIERTMGLLREKIGGKNIGIHARVASPLPPITSSFIHVERALVNIALNALEATGGEGEITIDAHSTGNDTLSISVSDTGPGILPEHQARLFDPFFTTKPTGTGLGLPIAYSMIQNVKGHISFTTNNRGTTFTVELPINGHAV